MSVCMSVWHVRALCSNGRRYRRKFSCIEQTLVSPRSCYSLAYIGQLFFPTFCPKVTQPILCWFGRRWHSMANCGRMVTDTATVTMESLLETNRCHRWSLWPPIPPKMGFHMPPICVNGHIFATGDPIHFMFGSGVGFSRMADLMAVFSIRTNPRWRLPPSWIISNGHISATAHTIYLYSAHRAVIFAIAQLSCFCFYFCLSNAIQCMGQRVCARALDLRPNIS